MVGVVAGTVGGGVVMVGEGGCLGGGGGGVVVTGREGAVLGGGGRGPSPPLVVVSVVTLL